jgi:dolichyl-diphosphooligosaccharide---protein glycosyltransferase
MATTSEEITRQGMFEVDSSDNSDDQEETTQENKNLLTSLPTFAEKWTPALRVAILGLICFIAVSSRIFSIIRYESVIHEFDPWFNYRATKVLSEKGFYAFKYWVDQEAWYPLGRYSGVTLFPGLMITAWIMHLLLNHVLMVPVDIREVCVFTAPCFSAFTSITAYLLTVEVSGKTGAGLLAALFMATIPTYMSRSVAGSYDNEAVAIFALVFSFYTFVRSLNTGSMIDALLAAFALYYMVLTWGGYVFVLGFMSVFIVALIFLNRLNIKAYITFSTVYIVGNMMSLTVPFVSIWAVWQSSEHLPSHIAFILMQLYYIRLFLKTKLSEEKFNFLTRILIRFIVFFVISGFIYIIVMGKTTAGHRILTLINPVYAKKHNPLVASISEHQSTAWSSMFFDIQYMLFFAPVGAYYCLKNVQNSKLFAVLYCLIGTYFASVMIRLMLVSGPACCVLSGIGISYILTKLTTSIKFEVKSFLNIKQKARKLISVEFALIALGLIVLACCRAVFHGTWSAAEAYSHPSIIMAYNQGNRRVIVDDYREAYGWLRHNTKPTARVMSWWDYGYQIAGMGNRTTIVDNNTWNKTHIGRVGMVISDLSDYEF